MCFIRNLPHDIPRFGGLAAGLGFLVFGLAATFAESRPSSTAGLGLIAVPVLSLIFGALGNLAGRLVRAALSQERLDRPSSQNVINALNAILVVVLLGAAGAGIWSARKTEDNAKPEVLVDSGMFVRSTELNSSTRVRPALQIFDFDEKALGIPWGRNLSVPRVAESTVDIADHKSGKRASIPITGLDYVTRIDAAMLSLPGVDHPMLALVIDGRATGFRAIAAVLDTEYRVLYAERLERSWSLDAPGVEIRQDEATNEELVVIGPTCGTPIQLRVRRGG